MKIATAIFVQILAFGILQAQDFTRFYRDSAEIQTAKQLLPVAGNSLWMGGTKGSSGENTRAWLYRLKQDGEVIRRISFPGIQSQVWVGMDTLHNGAAAVIGLQEFSGETKYYLAICRGDSLESWRYLEGLDNAVLDDARPAKNGRLLLCGFRSSPGIAGNDFFISRIQIDSARTDWIFQEGYGPNDHISMGKELPDGSVLFCGTVSDQGNYNPCLGKLDSSGNQIWLNVISTQWNDGAQKFTVSENGDTWLVGESSTSAGSFFDTELFRLNSEGQLLWQQWLGSAGQDAAFLIERKSVFPGFWVAGYSNAGSNGTGPISPFLMSLDSSGESQGEAFWNMSAPSPVYSMLAKGDSVFYFCGISNNQAYLMRRKNPELNPVFVLKTLPLKWGHPENFSLSEILKNAENGHFKSIHMLDIQGRILSKINPSQNTIDQLLLHRGFSILVFEKKDGSLQRLSIQNISN